MNPSEARATLSSEGSISIKLSIIPCMFCPTNSNEKHVRLFENTTAASLKFSIQWGGEGRQGIYTHNREDYIK